MVHVGLTVVEPVGHGGRCTARGGVLCGGLYENLKLGLVTFLLNANMCFLACSLMPFLLIGFASFDC